MAIDFHPISTGPADWMVAGDRRSVPPSGAQVRAAPSATGIDVGAFGPLDADIVTTMLEHARGWIERGPAAERAILWVIGWHPNGSEPPLWGPGSLHGDGGVDARLLGEAAVAYLEQMLRSGA